MENCGKGQFSIFNLVNVWQQLGLRNFLKELVLLHSLTQEISYFLRLLERRNKLHSIEKVLQIKYIIVNPNLSKIAKRMDLAFV
jgi:hypothetical protein